MTPNRLPLEMRGFATVLRPLTEAEHSASALSGWDTTLHAMSGWLNPASFVKEALQGRADGRLLPVAIFRGGHVGIAGIASFDTVCPIAGRSVLGRTHLMSAKDRRETRLEVKYLMLRCAFEHMGRDAVTVRAPWREDITGSEAGDEAREEVAIVHQIMEDVGRFGDMGGFVIGKVDWPMLRIRMEGRIGRMIQMKYLSSAAEPAKAVGALEHVMR